MFLDTIKNEMAKEWLAAINHPFGEQIANGKLDPLAYIKYKFQGLIYIDYYEKHWKKLSLLTTNVNEIDFAKRQVKIIKQMIIKSSLKLKIENISEIKILDGTRQYVNYMNEIAKSDDYEKLLFVLLACFVVYAYLGKNILKLKQSKKYSEWINAYTTQDYFKETNKLMLIVERRWSKMNDNKKAVCKNIFKRTLVLEKGFFDQVL